MPRTEPLSRLKSAIATVLLLPVGLSPVDLSAASPPGPGDSAPLTGDEKLLQVLDRFTYGPRPGDLENIRAIGIQAWFDRQLAPGKIDDSALEARLAQYPAMQLSLAQLMQMFPNQQMVRKVVDGRAERPGGEAEDAIYNDSISRYRAKLAGKNVPAGDGMAEDDAVEASTLPQDAPTLIAMPPERRFSAICKFTPQQLKALRRSLQPEQRMQMTAGFSPRQLEELAALVSPQGVIAAEDVQSKLLRDIYSERQLNEVMVDFWLNHFNVYMRKSQDAPYYIAAYARDSIRPYALGSFENLLIASATSPAMLNYLDNSSSVGPHSQFAERPARPFAPQQQKKQTGLNENYARELMELHTLGVDGGYTQQDVTEVAKVFTGWTVGSPGRGDPPAQSQFDQARHEPGSKTVLGVTIKENGEKEGIEVLHILAGSPRTARFISTKLAIRFVSDDPPTALIDRMTQTFLTTHGDIRKVLLAMVGSPEFFNSAIYRAKVKTPQDFVISAVRASGADVQSAGAIAGVISDLGMPVYGMQTPNGYSMKADPWNSSASLVARLNFSLALATNRVVGVKTDWSKFLDLRPDLPQAARIQPEGIDSAHPQLDAQAKERSLEDRLLHMKVSDRTRDAILAQVTSDPAQQEASLQQVAVEDRRRDPLAAQNLHLPADLTAIADPQSALAAGLLFGSPEFQRR